LLIEKKADLNTSTSVLGETILIWLASEQWEPEDQGHLSEGDEHLWDIFLSFLDEFFVEEGAPARKKDKRKWSSSVESILTKTTTKKNVFLPPKSISKAIPGGKYGCAQFLKCCGPLALKSCSLGKLSQLVQDAINRGFLVYHKTLLIKSTNPSINR
jgi:hypothetical protein